MPPSSEPGRGELSALNVLRAFCVLGKCITRSGGGVSKKLNTGEEAAGSTAEFLNCAHLATMSAMIDAPWGHKSKPAPRTPQNQRDSLWWPRSQTARRCPAPSPFDRDQERSAGPPSDNPPDFGFPASTNESVERERGPMEISASRRGHGWKLRA
jgi:hypothetical protein